MTLIVHVEGHTEESFVNEVLAPHLDNHGFATIRAGFIGGMQGGITSWTVAQRDIVNHLRDDPTCIATTMVDYYGLPREVVGRHRAGRFRPGPDPALRPPQAQPPQSYPTRT